ncbi:MAG: helix-hairpin-helix domain-containing protein [Halobacteriales archaeon]
MGLISAIKSALGLEDSHDRAGGTEVTVERSPDAESERAVKETDPGAAGATADSGGGSGDAESEPTEKEAAGGSEPVDDIKGIGPSYADRLGEAGVETVADLAAADAADLAEASGIGEGRLRKWIERAQARAT